MRIHRLATGLLLVGLLLMASACGRTQDDAAVEAAVNATLTAIAAADQVTSPAPVATGVAPETAAPTPTPATLIPDPLYFIDGASGQIMRLEANGADLIQITDEARPITDFDVGPEGRRLVYVSGNQLIESDAFGGNRRVKVRGEALDDNPDDRINREVRAPRFSPDGRFIAFGLNGVNLIPTGGATDYTVLQPNSEFPDLRDPGSVRLDEPIRFFWPESWSPDGAKLLLNFAYWPEAGGLAILDVASGELVDLQSEEPNVVACCDAAWSTDSGTVYIASNFLAYGNPGLARVDAASGALSNLIAGIPEGEPGPDNPLRFFRAPFVAPDGSLLLFGRISASLGDEEQGYTIHRYAPAGGVLTQESTVAFDLSGAVRWGRDGAGAVVTDPTEISAPEQGGVLTWAPVIGGEAVVLPGSGLKPRWGVAGQPPLSAAATTIPPVPETVGSPEAEALQQFAFNQWGLAEVQEAGEFGAIEDVHAFGLQTGGAPLWVAHTVGMRSFDPEQSHLVGLFRATDNGWQEIARFPLNGRPDEESTEPGPDYVDAGWVKQVTVTPDRFWLQVDGGVGAHSGTFNLLSFDGSMLTMEASGFSSAPGAGEVADLNGDGVGEVLLNATDYYVFCYACGVRQVQYNILRWDDEEFQPVVLTELDETAPADLREHNQELITLAQAGLWKDAAALLAQAPTPADDPTYGWNALLVRTNAEAKQAVMQSDGAYPLLDALFFGDYGAAMEIVAQYDVAQIFSNESPLIVDTVAEGQEEILADWIIRLAEPAVEVMPDLADAHFLLAWANWLLFDENAALSYADQAAALAPDNALFIAAADQLSGRGPAAQAVQETGVASGALRARTTLNVRQGPGVNYPIVGQLAADESVTVTGRNGDADDPWWQIRYPPDSQENAWVIDDGELVELEERTASAPVVVTPEPPANVVGSGRIFFSTKDGQGQDTVFQVSAGGAAVPIVQDAIQPAIQPGGNRLAFQSTRDDMLGLGGYDLVTGERLRFSFNVEDGFPTWDPTLQQIIFASTRYGDDKWRLYQLWADGRGEATDLGFGQDPDWHPLDARVAYKGCDETGARCGLWIMAPDGSDRRQLTDNPGDSRPEWTPNGRFILFMSDQRDGNWEVYRVDVESGVVLRLSNNPANDGLPAVSPDGRQVAFMSNRGGVWTIQVVGIDGGPARILYTIGADVPDWLVQGLEWER